MKRRSLTLIYAVLVLAVLLSPLQSDNLYAAKKRTVDKLKYPELNPINLPDVQKAEISNGIKLRVMKNEKLPIVDLYILLKGGSAYDPKTKVGLADLTSGLLRIGGTRKMNGEAMDKLLDAKGISINISATSEYYSVYVNCLKENLDEALGVLASVLREPAFDKEKLEELKTKTSSGISRRNDSPAPINSREFRKLIYGADSPFAIVQEHEHVDNISVDDIAKTWQSFFTPGNMLVGAIGPLEVENVKTLFEKHFADWNAKSKIPPFPKVQEQKHDFKVAFAEKSDLNQSYFRLGHLGIIQDKKDTRESAKITVFNSIFSRGFNSRLFVKVRTQMGLTYGVSGGIGEGDFFEGATFFSSYTKSPSTVKAINAIFGEIDRIRKEKVTPKELKDAKDYYLNSYVFNFSSPEQILFRSLTREFYGVPEGTLEQMIEDIKNVTAEDVLDAANKYLHPEKIVLFVVGNREKIDEGDKLASLGNIKAIDISIKPPPLKEKIPAATPETLKKGKDLIAKLFKTTYKGYKTLKSTLTLSDMKLTMPQGTFPMTIKATTLYPDKSHREIVIMGMKMKQVTNGLNGVIHQMGQQKSLPQKDIEKGRFNDTYHILHGKGNYNYQYLKEEKIDGKTFDVVYIFNPKIKDQWIKWFVNKETGYVEVTESISSMPGQSGVQRAVSSEFKVIKGIPFSFKSIVTLKGKTVAETATKEIKVNPKVDLKLFEIKEKK